ncbi:MAG: 50S ribosomal protein L3 [Oscillospiraceae bacterium]|nr:50S ribosomal protein L3 [Oscillospiraceae bacterium]
MSRMPVEKGIIGKKLGMTQIFIPANGNVIPVTVIEAGPCSVIQKKTVANDGYSSVQLGFIDYTEKKERKIIKPMKGHFKKAGVAAKRHLKEFKLKNAEELNVGDKIEADCFKEGEKVDVTGMTKGRGFTGAVKRWGLHTQSDTHGVGPVHRHAGSMGANSDPSRIMKNKKMPGQYGHEQVTILNLEVIKIDKEKNIVAVKGAIPGPKGSIVFIRSTVR